MGKGPYLCWQVAESFKREVIFWGPKFQYHKVPKVPQGTQKYLKVPKSTQSTQKYLKVSKSTSKHRVFFYWSRLQKF